MTEWAPILALVMAAVCIVASVLPRRRQTATRAPERRQLMWDSRAACAEIDACAHRVPHLRLMDTRLPARPDNPREAR